MLLIVKNAPHVWKTNGDEVVFVVEILSNFDVIVACKCFAEIVSYYAEELKKRSLEYTDQAKSLSAKGTLWVSSFHTNAFAIPLSRLVGGVINSGPLNEYILV
jgi:hypothetical protein